MRGLTLGFAGTPVFAERVLATLLDSPHSVRAVYTQPDRPAGRGRKLQPGPVKTLALARQLPVFQPASLKDAETTAQIADLDLDLLVVVAYGLILPQTILDTPRFGCLNVHASLLPRWRGAAPIERALLAGDEMTGISIMQMEAGLDTGPVILQADCPIAADDSAGALHDRLAALGARCLLDALALITNGDVHPRQQDHNKAVYADKISKDEATLDWNEPADTLARMVRAFNPRPGCLAQLDDMPIKIWQARAESQPVDAAPGTRIRGKDKSIAVATGNGVLHLLELQLPGKQRVSSADLLNARPEWA